MTSRWVAVVVVPLLLAGLAYGDDPKPAKLGKKIDTFKLKDAAGKEWSLAGSKDKKAIVVLFVGTECPVNNAFMPRLGELHKEFDSKGVQFLAINSNKQDTVEKIAAHLKKHALPFPVLKDEGNVVADLFAARRTPEAFVLDAGFTVRYAGRIDDQFGIGFTRPKPTREDLKEALTEVLAGKEVSQPAVAVAGCLIAREVKPKGEAKVTYAKQVSRILQNNCQECHRPGQIGPMSLLTYESAAAWSETIKEVVSENRMPPWHADPKHGTFINDRRLPKEDRENLLAWIDAGCPKGDDKDLPKAREFAEGWRIGKPDAVFKMETEAKVPAQAKNGIPYKYYFVKTNFEEDKWVVAAEAKPGNSAVVHHIIVYAGSLADLKPGGGGGGSADGIGNRFLVGYAPGDMPAIYPEGVAKRLPKGGILAFQMHYTPNGKEETDKSEVGLIFAKEAPKQEARTRSIATRNLEIPAGEANHKVKSSTVFKEDAVLYSLLPHMHLRGKSFEYKVTYPDGKSEILLWVPKYDFGWQTSYRLAKPIELPAGSRIDCTAHFDNSKGNPNNPDPLKIVKWGDQTWDEMMIGFVDYAYKK